MSNQAKIPTVIYGGAFNPPTIAHQVILQSCVDYANEIEADIWLLPSGNRTDKQIDTSRDRRLEYIDAMIEDVTNLQNEIGVLHIELDRDVPVETYDTIQELNGLYPDREFIWVFGADSTQTMTEWKNGQWLLDNTKMLLVGRPGSQTNPAVQDGTPLEIPSLDVSSTELRRRIAMREDFDELVSNSVFRLLTHF